MALAMNRAMQQSHLLVGAAVLVSASVLPRSVGADEERAIMVVEARMLAGVASGGGRGGDMVFRPSPLHLGLLGETAVMVEPWTSLYGEVFVEAKGREAFGVGLGARVRPRTGQLRASIGVEAIVAPYSLLGVVAGAGSCPLHFDIGRMCADVEGRIYLTGDDLPAERVAAQLTASIGVAFDAF